jgi:acyl-CoA synthetase (AMP-forming)/AMP-acid ligase II
MTALNSMISRSAQWFSTATAVTDGRRTVSFADVDSRSNRLAQVLLGYSGELGARVAMLMPNCVEAVEVDFAIIKSGKVKVPINVRLSPDERAYLIGDSGAETLIFDSSAEDSVAEILDGLPDLRFLLRIGPGTLGDDYEDSLLAAADSLPAVTLEPAAPSLFLYTSGTTGRPKGAITTNGSRLAGTLNMLANEIDPRPGDAMAHVGSMAHGSGSKILAHFLRGSRNIPVAKWEPHEFLRLVAATRATHTFLVPTMISQLVDAATASDDDWSCLKTITYGGAPMPAARLEAALDVLGPRLVQVYGSCEAPHPVLVLTTEDHARRGNVLSAAGREVVGVETRMLTSDGSPARDGEPGELVVRGANVMSGYWQKPEATNEVLYDGWYRTGDVALRDADGYIYIVDRARDLIISGGYNVYPAEVEAVLARHAAVAEVAVVGVPDDKWGEAVRAVVVRSEDATATESELIDFCAQNLAGYKKPKAIDFVGELPHGSTNKVLRREVRDRYWNGRQRRV